MGVGVAAAMIAAIPRETPWGSRGRNASNDSASDARSAIPDGEAPCPGPFHATTATGSGRRESGFLGTLRSLILVVGVRVGVPVGVAVGVPVKVGVAVGVNVGVTEGVIVGVHV